MNKNNLADYLILYQENLSINTDNLNIYINNIDVYENNYTYYLERGNKIKAKECLDNIEVSKKNIANTQNSIKFYSQIIEHTEASIDSNEEKIQSYSPDRLKY